MVRFRARFLMMRESYWLIFFVLWFFGDFNGVLTSFGLYSFTSKSHVNVGTFTCVLFCSSAFSRHSSTKEPNPLIFLPNGINLRNFTRYQLGDPLYLTLKLPSPKLKALSVLKVRFFHSWRRAKSKSRSQVRSTHSPYPNALVLQKIQNAMMVTIQHHNNNVMMATSWRDQFELVS